MSAWKLTRTLVEHPEFGHLDAYGGVCLAECLVELENEGWTFTPPEPEPEAAVAP